MHFGLWRSLGPTKHAKIAENNYKKTATKTAQNSQNISKKYEKTPTKITKKNKKKHQTNTKKTKQKAPQKSSQKVSGNYVRKRQATTVILEDSRDRPPGARNNVIKARKKKQPVSVKNHQK